MQWLDQSRKSMFKIYLKLITASSLCILEIFINLKYLSCFSKNLCYIHFRMKVTFTTILVWDMLCNIHMVISTLSDRLLSNLLFHLHRQFSSRFDIDHLSIWFVNHIKICYFTKWLKACNSVWECCYFIFYFIINLFSWEVALVCETNGIIFLSLSTLYS